VNIGYLVLFYFIDKPASNHCELCTGERSAIYNCLVYVCVVEFIGPFLVAYQNLTGRCLVCKHDSHVINIPKADWSSVKNKHLTATP